MYISLQTCVYNKKKQKKKQWFNWQKLKCDEENMYRMKK